MPRLLFEPAEALYCSRFLLRMLLENKLPSNKSLVVISDALTAAVDHVQFSTEREVTKCIPVFVNDLLRVFKPWDHKEKLAAILQAEIGMEKFTERRY
jgi:hypothetical protein